MKYKPNPTTLEKCVDEQSGYYVCMSKQSNEFCVDEQYKQNRKNNFKSFKNYDEAESHYLNLLIKYNNEERI